jgi:hypothetical protein
MDNYPDAFPPIDRSIVSTPEQSVAHYLITTRLVSGEDAPPIMNLPLAQREQFQRRRARVGVGVGVAGGAKGAAAANAASKKRREARSVHWSPYDRVRVVNADP